MPRITSEVRRRLGETSLSNVNAERWLASQARIYAKTRHLESQQEGLREARIQHLRGRADSLSVEVPNGSAWPS